MADLKKVMQDTIHDDLSTTFEAMMKAAEEEEQKFKPTEEEETDDAVQEGEKEEGEKEEEIETKEPTSEEVTKEPSEDDEKSTDEEEEEKQELGYEPGDLEPNSGWDKETQEGFRQLPEAMQEFMLKRYSEMQSDYTRKTKDVAGIKRALEPARKDIEESGLTDAQAIENLVATHGMLKSKPTLAIQYLMTAYGISLDAVQSEWQDSDTFVKNLKENARLGRVENQLDAINTEKAREASEAHLAELKEFRETHEHYDLVESTMSQIARGMLVSGKPKPDLEDLYEEALWLNPQTRQMKIDEEKKAKPKTGKDVKKAKKAATRVKATPKTKTPEPEKPKSIREELSQGWDKTAGA